MSGPRCRHCIKLKFLQVIIFDEDGDAEPHVRRQDIHERSFQRNRASQKFTKFLAPRKRLIPELQALTLAQIEVSDRAKIALEKLPARRQIEALERIGQQLEVRIFNRQARGRRGAGAGHTAYTPYFYSSPRGIGKTSTPFDISDYGEQVEVQSKENSSRSELRAGAKCSQLSYYIQRV